MNLSKLWVRGLLHAAGAVAYVILVAGFLNFAQRSVNYNPGIWVPIAMLLLLVFSATLMGSVILGKPILMYVDGQKQEALKLFGFTLMWLFVFLIIIFILLATAFKGSPVVY